MVVEGDSTVREGEEGCEREKEKVGDGKESYDLQEAGGVKGGSAMEERMEERMAAHVQFCTSGMYCTCGGGGGWVGGGGGGRRDNAGCLGLRLPIHLLSEKSYPLSIRS